jgi:cob(I)alamin adenosyltransferase
MRIYTRTGDEGSTGLLGGARVPKDHLRTTAYGDIDELSSCLGFLRCVITDPANATFLEKTQSILMEAGTEMATPPGQRNVASRITEADVTRIEEEVDRLDGALPSLGNFVIPGGSESASRAHIARCVCRRAERAVVRMLRAEPSETHVLRYLNRLSDYLFVLARWENRKAGIPDQLWHPRPKTGLDATSMGPTESR